MADANTISKEELTARLLAAQKKRKALREKQKLSDYTSLKIAAMHNTKRNGGRKVR